MKILFFIRSLEQGGSERQLAVLASGLAKRGHDVAIALFYEGGTNEKLLVDTPLRLIKLRKSGRWDVVGPLFRLWRAIRSERPDILYAFLPTQTAIAALLLRFTQKVRLVFGIRAAGMQGGRYDALSALVYPLEAKLSRYADLVVANAEAGRIDAIQRGMPADRIVVIPNGIDTNIAKPDDSVRQSFRRRWNIDSDSFVIGLIARLDPMKDHPTFLKAAAKFARLDTSARFVCIGTGSDQYREALKENARLLGLTENIVWEDRIADARAVYNAFEITTLSSAFGEAFPNVVGEAMACGVPIAATDVGDVAAVVGNCGEIVAPGDADLLCDSWTRLRRRLADESNLRVAARDRIVTLYGADTMVARTEDAMMMLCREDALVKGGSRRA